MARTAELVLREIIATGDCVTPSQIVSSTGLSSKQVKHSLDVLTRNGLATTPRRACYRATDAARQGDAEVSSGPRKGVPQGRRLTSASGLRGRTWWVLRKIRKGTLADIVELAAKAEKRPETAVQAYLSILAQAGYVHVLRRPTPARYLLVRDTGPQAPSWSARYGTIYDPNTSEEIALQNGGDA
ncbi:hypothetical protein [Oceanibaculum indicum]|uniref:HTH iclR-type domain-containing protein n=1 Tax=Oceanibaculum indicum P24 TaxID=1207063 RepID=K2KLY1_9PROT|nr:hypothetical protein [Oceanibaculum indicum]EKE78465.1 hypothetical protein P24_02856 [Oceanibaculum indicum P24]